MATRITKIEPAKRYRVTQVAPPSRTATAGSLLASLVTLRG